jgi:cytochrome c-type protein NapB
MYKRLLLLIFVLPLLYIACGDGGGEVQTAKDWLSDDQVATMVSADPNALGAMPAYSLVEPGEAQTIDRSFENAPPMIPHKVVGLIPITRQNNECLNCHMPDKAEENKAVPLPQTHFTNYRPSITQKDDGLYSVDAQDNAVFAKELGTELSSAIFNCTLCHAPQANVTVEVDNVFVADFRDSDGKSKSNLKDIVGEGVK